EPLLIDTGYYPWYGSPHHVLWTRQTRAHNAILVNGRGQGNFSMEASGRIEYCRTSGKLTLVRGEAGAAYNVPLSESTLSQWREHLAEPVPSMEPAVLLARRTLAFTGSKERPWMAVQDYLETDGPAYFDYLLHAQEEMQLDQDQGTILVKSGQARLIVHLLADNGLSFSQSSEFIPPPGDRYENAPRQWHFSARTAVAPGRARFLALFIPYREGEKPPEVEGIQSGETRGFRVGDETVLAWWGEGETGRCEGYGEGRLFLELNEDGARKKHTAE
ncbi:MAG: heparinase II/III family protein, partial [Candidatus Glassbacteria bacterium]|nr:heparinase II/III family protein [Candidatus Glassbacteria bacterium]